MKQFFSSSEGYCGRMRPFDGQLYKVSSEDNNFVDIKVSSDDKNVVDIKISSDDKNVVDIKISSDNKNVVDIKKITVSETMVHSDACISGEPSNTVFLYIFLISKTPLW